MARSDQWNMKGDIEDVLIDPTLLWRHKNPSTDMQTKKDSLSVFHDDKEKSLEIFEFIRTDGVSNTMIFGVPRRLTPARKMEDDLSATLNCDYFYSLSDWLR